MSGTFQISGGRSYIWGNSRKSDSPSSFLKVLTENGPKQVCFLPRWVIIDFKFNLAFLGRALSSEVSKVPGVPTCWAELRVPRGSSSSVMFGVSRQTAPSTAWYHALLCIYMHINDENFFNTPPFYFENVFQEGYLWDSCVKTICLSHLRKHILCFLTTEECIQRSHYSEIFYFAWFRNNPWYQSSRKNNCNNVWRSKSPF